tara:strand:- start:1027 stop:1488 length:462 start_codon:yes stop_codon:yes gene_type:complete
MEGQHYHIENSFHLENCTEAIVESWKEYGSILVYIIDGRQRSELQNALQHAMYREIGKQLFGGDMEHAKCECKLTIGVPILRETSEDFRRVYDNNLKKLVYDAKLEVIGMISISSLFSVECAHRYIDLIYDTYAQKGVNWTNFINRSKDALKA